MKIKIQLLTITLSLICLLTKNIYAQLDPWNEFIGASSIANNSNDVDSPAGAQPSYALSYAWNERHNLRAILTAFEISGDQSYLNDAIDRINNMLNHRDSVLSINTYQGISLTGSWATGISTTKAYPVWSRYFGTVRRCDGTMAWFLEPIIRCAYIMKSHNYNYLSDNYTPTGSTTTQTYSEWADDFITAVRQAIDHLNSWAIVTISGNYYYIDRGDLPLEPTAWNYAVQAANVMLYLSQDIFADSISSLKRLGYLLAATQIANTFRDELIHHSSTDSYEWRYYPLERLINQSSISGPPWNEYWWEDIAHGASEMQMVYLFRKFNSNVFNDEDLRRFANTIERIFPSTGINVDFYVNGTSEITPEDAVRPWRTYQHANDEAAKHFFPDWSLIASMSLPPAGGAADHRPGLSECYRLTRRLYSSGSVTMPECKLMSLANSIMPKNLSFEYGILDDPNNQDQWACPSYWIPYGDDGNSNINHYRSGWTRGTDNDHVACIHVNDLNPTASYIGFYQEFACLPSTDYELTADVRVNLITGGTYNYAAVALKFKDSDGNLTNNSDITTTQNVWENLSVSATSPNDAISGIIYLYVRRGFLGDARFDDIDLNITGTTLTKNNQEYANKVNAVPNNFYISQNYPNPFNPQTDINYKLSEKIHVEIKIYDILGTEVTTLVNNLKDAGSYKLTWDASLLPAGVYFYKIRAGNYSKIKKMILLK
ncbi:MAG: T9SS type A sorting domain-containing protein [Candidatus Lokiarchaeota archaeon]|nr:T9SS type A sorting domain-containing protein [Candidatus Lokiarchaeota archaeon]